MSDLDVLLPNMSSDADDERSFVAAFTDDKGACSLANRIRGQFELHLNQSGETLSVSHSMLQPMTQDAGTSVEHVVARMATILEEAIDSQIASEAVHHE